MSLLHLSKEFLTEVKLGNVPGHKLVHKFGKNSSVGTSPVPIATGGVYQTPTANQALEIISDDANDTAAGTGARKVTVQGLTLDGGLFVSEEEEITMNGTTAVNLANSYIRIFRAWISESGTYASMTAVSSPGTLTIRDQGGAGVNWLIIDEFASGNSAGQSQTAMYTTPSNTTSILYSPQFTIDSNKTVSMYFFNRPNADDVTTPYTGARRLIHEWLGMDAGNPPTDMLPVAAFDGATDMGFLGEVSATTGAISAEFWLLEIED